MSAQKVVIVGGGAAGTSCAFELRKLDKEVEITILEKGSYLEYSPCALPYVLSGEIESFEDIFIFKKEDYENNNIRILLDTTVKEIDRESKKLKCTTTDKKTEVFYDKLVLATGSVPQFPSIKGLDQLDPATLKTITDAKQIQKSIKKGGKSVVVGAGLIGLELAVALSKNGEKVSVLDIKDRPLSFLLDKDMSKQVTEYLSGLGIDFFFNSEIDQIDQKKIYFKKDSLDFDKLYLCTGMRAELDLAQRAGLEVGEAIEVNDRLQSSDKNIYACGDCVSSTELNTEKKILSQLGTIAVRQGRVVARNILGQDIKTPKVLNNTITKIGEIFVGSVGLSLERARQEGLEAVAARYSGEVRSEYYPPSSLISVKVVSDKAGKLIGAQVIGWEEVAGRMNLLSLAIEKGMSLDDLINMETCYNPASAPINEPVSVACEVCKKKLSLIQ